MLRRFTLEEYADRGYRDFPKELSVNLEGIQVFWELLGTRRISNMGDVGEASRLLMSMQGRRRNVDVRNARNMTARVFMRGNFA